MFFRRQKPVTYTFSQRLSALREAGFQTQEKSPGRAEASRGNFVAALAEQAEQVQIAGSGRKLGEETAGLVSQGYQTIWRTPSGAVRAATANELASYHAFLEDLREALGLTSLYNESLGSTHTYHDYDRVSGRE